MNRETTSKVHKGQQGANPKMRMLVYRERSYPARKVQGRDGSYTVAADSLVPELLDGTRSLDPALSSWTRKSPAIARTRKSKNWRTKNW